MFMTNDQNLEYCRVSDMNNRFYAINNNLLDFVTNQLNQFIMDTHVEVMVANLFILDSLQVFLHDRIKLGN